jgi:hypothetical protein
MDKPTAVLEPARGYLHGRVINPLPVKIAGPGYGVDFAVKTPGRDKTLNGKFPRRDSIAVRYGIGRRHVPKTIIGNCLASEPAYLPVILEQEKPVPRIVFPVVFKGIRLMKIFPEIIGCREPFCPELYLAVFHGKIITYENGQIPLTPVKNVFRGSLRSLLIF